MEKIVEYFAHSPNDFQEKWEPLATHLEAVAKTSAEFCNQFGASELGYLAGLFHDIGKYQKTFQKRLKGANIKVEHSICGAKEILEILKSKEKNPLNNITAELLAIIIAAHHSGLPDIGTIGDNFSMPTLQARLLREVEDFSAYKKEIEFKTDLPNWIERFLSYEHKERPFAMSVLARMLYSALVDADSLETEKHYQGEREYTYSDFKELKALLDKKLASFRNTAQNSEYTTNINEKRNQIQNMCAIKASGDRGLYSLTVPTGGGKTLSSMVFALNHLLKNGHRRIIYVIPYTSIIEQTAAVFKGIFGEENVLEHHSNYTSEDDDSETETLKLSATENWDAPIILTTNVQFFESLFCNKRGINRKIHNIANSVIIFDEAQMIPINLLAPCMKTVDILTRNFNCTALLMSATCPDYLPFMCKNANITEINTDYRQHFVDFARTSSQFLGAKSNEELLQLIDLKEQTLIIVNTRKAAAHLYNTLPENCNKYHLSTLMCPKDRSDTLKEIKQDLTNGQPITVVSTQLIECGVDLDFSTVFRACAGIDSIVQAAGRCNREGKRQNAQVYIFESENDPKRGDIQIHKNFARNICKTTGQKDILTLENIEKYFGYILDKNEVEPDQKEILKMFKIGSQSFYLDFSFDECNKAFNYIEQINKCDIIVPLDDEVRNILSDIKNKGFGTRKQFRKLAKYTVSVFQHEYKALQKQEKLQNFDFSDRTYVLADLGYYTKIGLDIAHDSRHLYLLKKCR